MEPSESNYTTRTVYIQTLYEQESIYLLNTSAYNTVESRFTLNDPTGQYGSESVVYVQRPINISGQVTWQTVLSDQFGAEGVTAQLEEGQRYRIKVSNPEGDEQIIGPYRADVSEEVVVRPGTPSIDLSEFQDGWSTSAQLNNRTLEWRYADPTGETDELTVYIHERGDPNNLLVANSSHFQIGNASAVYTLSENESQKEWVVNFIINREGETLTKQIIVSNRANVGDPLGSGWQAIVGIGLLILIGAAFSVLNAAVGAVIVSLMGGIFWWIGLLGDITSAAAIAIAMLIAVFAVLSDSGRP